MTIKEMRKALLDRIHESVPALEYISDMEVCTMGYPEDGVEDDGWLCYEEIIEIAERLINNAKARTIYEWYCYLFNCGEA